MSFTVTNNGTMSAEEVVQLYVHDQLATVTTVRLQSTLDSLTQSYCTIASGSVSYETVRDWGVEHYPHQSGYCLYLNVTLFQCDEMVMGQSIPRHIR